MFGAEVQDLWGPCGGREIMGSCVLASSLACPVMCPPKSWGGPEVLQSHRGLPLWSLWLTCSRESTEHGWEGRRFESLLLYSKGHSGKLGRQLAFFFNFQLF